MKTKNPNEEAIIQVVEALAKKYRVSVTRRAVRKWDRTEAEKIKLTNERARIEERMAEIDEKL